MWLRNERCIQLGATHHAVMSFVPVVPVGESGDHRSLGTGGDGHTEGECGR